MCHRILLFAGMLCAGINSTTAVGNVDARLLRDPAVSQTQIAFVYAGDIWVVPKTGGTAMRLSSPPGEESSPRFSPDGSRIAFTGNYDGNSDIYLIGSMGGPVRRVTHHPEADRVLEWYGDGESLLLASRMQSGSRRFAQLHRMNAEGGLPERLPVPYAEQAALSEDGKWVAFTFTRRQVSWKRYRGGTAPDIWLFNLETLESRNISGNVATDDTPMWHGQKLYFLSDRGASQRFNVWCYSLPDGSTETVTQFEDIDVRSASIGPADIVFEAGGRLHRLDLASHTHQPVEIRVVTDLATLKPETRKVGDLVESMDLSPSGKRAVVAARGELFSVPAEHGPILQLTHSSGAAERYPAWSPDGKTLAYWTDREGEYELALRPAEAPGEEEIVTRLGAGYRYRLFWSPDSKRLAFIDHAQRIWVFGIDGSSLVEVDQARWWLHNALEAFRAAWSADSRWLAWARPTDNGNDAIFVFDTRDGEKRQLTSAFYRDSTPVFDPAGKYLFYQTDREMQALYGSIDPEMWTYANSARIAALPLRADVISPLAPRNDTEVEAEADKSAKDDDGATEAEAVDDAAGDETKGEESVDGANGESQDKGKDKGKDKAKDKTPPEVEIEFDNIERRLVLLPPEAGNYDQLETADDLVIYLRRPNTGSAEKQSRLLAFNLKDREEVTILDDVDRFTISGDRNKLLVSRKEQHAIIDARKDQKFEKPLRTGQLERIVDPPAEWRQIFTESWRWYRDFFYDPALHGLDWAGLRERYAKLMEDAVTRWDVNHVIGELISEINASHVRIGGGDTEEAPQAGVGMLGIDWALDQGAFRVAAIVRAGPWDAELRSALDQPGVKIAEGDYILAVNRRPLEAGSDPWSAFAGLEKRTVLLTVNGSPIMDGAREVLVETMSWEEEANLRHLAWVEANRRRVEEASQGRIGYIYMPNTGAAGQNNLMRQFKAQHHLPALIIDERFNAGGQLANRFLELLGRRPFAYLATRYGPNNRSPAVAHYGPQVMLINGWAGSGGDALPWYFRTANRGPILGVRTWGGLIGPAMSHRLIDGGSIVVPPMRLYGPEGRWFAEGHGVDPDIEVIEDPGALARGVDVQLERAITEATRLLVTTDHPQPPATPAPEIR
jgi:tricorn protease